MLTESGTKMTSRCDETWHGRNDGHGVVGFNPLPRQERDEFDPKCWGCQYREQMRITKIVEDFNDLRERCFELARADNGKLMGDDKWLRNALCEERMTLEPSSRGILCRGLAFTTQTQDNEWFEFLISWSDLGVRR